nr:DNA-dependent RNA polymerase subunit RPO19 [Vaccinia virus]WGO02215.1 DNA-dependent RNA polymerase subunit RPO19 [Vaccinia virus]WGO02444.1 DNA-dependent RNA polymerase subunit RPO19 [Vaccinia virus]WOG35521.1 DNA-dependent RNA polymerase subunit RPO19 [Vaccinia virus]WOG35749.1 DNA-dependent RNA polymerase subunit RPO19 [Vaccinia virus]
MADTDDIIDYESDDLTEYEDDEEEEEDGESLETSDIDHKSSYKIVESASTHIEDAHSNLKHIGNHISALKRRYTRRISLFEIAGIIAESYNLLQRGRLPLVSEFSDETMKQNMLHVIIQEIEEGFCPIVIEKNGELLSVNDFDKDGLKFHLDYIIKIWKLQKRY